VNSSDQSNQQPLDQRIRSYDLQAAAQQRLQAGWNIEQASWLAQQEAERERQRLEVEKLRQEAEDRRQREQYAQQMALERYRIDAANAQRQHELNMRSLDHRHEMTLRGMDRPGSAAAVVQAVPFWHRLDFWLAAIALGIAYLKYKSDRESRRGRDVDGMVVD
jgi:hypothetical protein